MKPGLSMERKGTGHPTSQCLCSDGYGSISEAGTGFLRNSTSDALPAIFQKLSLKPNVIYSFSLTSEGNKIFF